MNSEQISPEQGQALLESLLYMTPEEKKALKAAQKENELV